MTTTNKLKVEAKDQDITFEYSAETYTVPPAKLWPLEVMEAQEDGRMLATIRALLGEDQYKTLRKTAKVAEDLEAFLEVLFKAIDVDPKG